MLNFMLLKDMYNFPSYFLDIYISWSLKFGILVLEIFSENWVIYVKYKLCVYLYAYKNGVVIKTVILIVLYSLT